MGDEIPDVVTDLSSLLKKANYVVRPDDEVLFCDASGGAFSLYLPKAAAMKGKVLYIKKVPTDLTSNAVTVVPRPGEKVENASSVSITDSKTPLFLLCDGVAYYEFNYQAPAATSLTVSTYTPSLSQDGSSPSREIGNGGVWNYCFLTAKTLLIQGAETLGRTAGGAGGSFWRYSLPGAAGNATVGQTGIGGVKLNSLLFGWGAIDSGLPTQISLKKITGNVIAGDGSAGNIFNYVVNDIILLD